MAAAKDSHATFRIDGGGDRNGNGNGYRNDEYGFLTDARELRSFFREYEATIGMRSTFSAMLAAHNGISFGIGTYRDWDRYADNLDKICYGTRTYRALRRMDDVGQSEDVVILFRLYGPRSAMPEHARFGELAPLAIYTDAAEEAREQLALRESTKREEGVGEGVKRRQDIGRIVIERDFWHAAGKAMAAERRIEWHERKLTRDEDARAATRKRLVELHRNLQAWREVQKRTLDGFLYDGSLRARLGAITAADKQTTIEEALRWKLSKDDSAMFVVAIKRQADALRKRAHAAYREAKTWRAS